MVGIGGTINTVVAHAILTFHDDDKVRRSSYDVMVDFVANEPSADGLPSILGRDVLNRWRMDYDPTNNKLEFSVHSADLMI